MQTARTKDGRYVIRNVGENNWTEVSREEWDAAKRGVGSSFLSAARDRVQDIAGGIAESYGGVGVPNPVSDAVLPPRETLVERGRDVRTANDPRQEANRTVNPGSAFLGELAPEVALGALIRRPGLGVGVDAGIGAASDPENPVRGAIVGGAAGGAGVVAGKAIEAMPGAMRGMTLANRIKEGANVADVRAQNQALREAVEAGTPLRVVDNSLSAAVNPNATGELTEKVLGGVYDSDFMLERYGFPTSQAQKTILDTGDPVAYSRARSQDNEDFNESRARGGLRGQLKDAYAPIDNYADLAVIQQDAVNRGVMSAMGSNRVAASTDNVDEALDQISKNYDEIAMRAGNMEMGSTMDRIDDLIAEAPPGTEVDTALKEAKARIGSYLKQNGAGNQYLTAEDLMKIRNVLAKQARNAFKGQPTVEVGYGLNDVVNELDNRLAQALDAEDRSLLIENRSQYPAALAARNTAATTNDRGDINIRSYNNAYKRLMRRNRTAYRNNEFGKFLNSAAAAMFRETRDSGTPQGVATTFEGLLNAADVAGVPGAGAIRQIREATR